MNTTRTAIISIAIIALGLFFSSYQDPLKNVDKPYVESDKPLFTTTLNNGLHVTTKEIHTLPLVSIQFWVNVGSKQEPEGAEGVAHIFEHIWFKGTATQLAGSFHKKVENLGGELNAMTSHDWTMYYVTVPSDKFHEIFPNMVDLLKNPLFDQDEITRELQVILEEQRKSFNNPLRHADDKFAKLLIDEHPYGNPIIGYKSSISNMSRQQIIDYYNIYYVPNNMHIIVVGDIHTPEIVDTIERTLGDMQPAPLPEFNFSQSRPEEPQYNSSTRELANHYIAMGYLTPESTHPDHYVLDVINALFSEMDSSRMRQKLKQENLIIEGGSVSAQLRDLGAFEAYIVTDPDKRNEAVTALLTEIKRLTYEPISEEELERAKAYIKAKRARDNEEIFHIGMELGEFWIDGIVDEYAEYNERIDAVTQEDILRVANNYFTEYTMYEIKATE